MWFVFMIDDQHYPHIINLAISVCRNLARTRGVVSSQVKNGDFKSTATHLILHSVITGVTGAIILQQICLLDIVSRFRARQPHYCIIDVFVLHVEAQTR